MAANTLLSGHHPVAHDLSIIQALLVPEESGSENTGTLLARQLHQVLKLGSKAR